MFTYAESNVYVAGQDATSNLLGNERILLSIYLTRAIIYEALAYSPLFCRDEGLNGRQSQDQELKRDFKDFRYAEKQIGFNLKEKSRLCQ